MKKMMRSYSKDLAIVMILSIAGSMVNGCKIPVTEDDHKFTEWQESARNPLECFKDVGKAIKLFEWIICLNWLHVVLFYTIWESLIE